MTLDRPATCGHECEGLRGSVQLVPWLLAIGAPRVLKSTPDDAVVSLDMIVLLMMFTRQRIHATRCQRRPSLRRC